MALEMKAKKAKTDVYSNIAVGKITMSGANVLTFSQMQFAVGIFQGIAILLHRISWWVDGNTGRGIVAATDDLQMALTTSNRLTVLVETAEPAVLALRRIFGVGAAVEPFHQPIVTDFTSLPGGGKLIPANPIYLAMASAGLVLAASAVVHLDFTFIELSPSDYLELIQSQYPANIV